MSKGKGGKNMLNKKNLLWDAKLILFSAMFALTGTNAYGQEQNAADTDKETEKNVTVISMESEDSGPGFEISENN